MNTIGDLLTELNDYIDKKYKDKPKYRLFEKSGVTKIIDEYLWNNIVLNQNIDLNSLLNICKDKIDEYFNKI